MFGLEIIIASAITQIQLAQAEKVAFQKTLSELPEDQRASFTMTYRAAQERRRVEATAERRHQELCKAIRDSKPSGFGVFW